MPMQIPIYRQAFKITRKRRPWDTTESTSKGWIHLFYGSGSKTGSKRRVFR